MLSIRSLIIALALTAGAGTSAFAQMNPQPGWRPQPSQRDNRNEHRGGSPSRSGIPGGSFGHQGGDSVLFPSHNPWDSGVYQGRHNHEGYIFQKTIQCSPKDLSGNVATTDKTLKALASSDSFAASNDFKAQVARISTLQSSDQKAAEYFALAGIDAKDSKAVIDFIGAREAKGSWIVDLQRNANLSESQAEKVASALQSALRGGLN